MNDIFITGSIRAAQPYNRKTPRFTYLLPMVGRDEEFEIWKKNIGRKNVELIGRLDGWVQGHLKNRLQQSKTLQGYYFLDVK